MSGTLKNMAVSVRARLTNQARERKENAQLLMTRYVIERLLWRLSISDYRQLFVLKGAMLFSLWAPTPYRATGDLDLLGFGNNDPEQVAGLFREIMSSRRTMESSSSRTPSSALQPGRKTSTAAFA